MAGILTILLMSIALGVASFGVGARIAYLSTLGTGLLLGAALGIIIPEGVETLLSSNPDAEPARTVAMALLSGFAFMLLVEQLSSDHAHDHNFNKPRSPYPVHASLDSQRALRGATGSAATPRPADDSEEFDLDSDLAGAERGEEEGQRLIERRNSQTRKVAERARALPLTLGLVIHSLADGLALGASALATTGHKEDEGGDSSGPNVRLSLVVFFALLVHKAPTALALSMSLLSKSLTPSECRKHLAFFSLATPLGALGSFGLLSLVGVGAHEDWTGTALLVSGGTFLYVATVLQSVSQHTDSYPHPSSEMNDKIRALLIVAGMFIPFLISLVIGHGH